MIRRTRFPFVLLRHDPDPPPQPTPPAPPDPPPAPSSFTQADLDRIVGQRLAEERQKFAGFDDLKAKAAKFDEIEAANQSELEKVTKRAADAEAAAAANLAKAQQAAIRAAVAAASTEAVDAEAVMALIDTSKLTVSDDLAVTGAAEAVTALLEAKPFLKRGGQPPAPPGPTPSGGPRPTPTGADLAADRNALRGAASKLGVSLRS